MANESSRRLPGTTRTTTFDVRTWLADLGRCSIDDVRYVAEDEKHGQLTVTYDCRGESTRVRVNPVGGVGTAAWEITAEWRSGVERVVVPGGTRFVWRATPGGTHP